MDMILTKNNIKFRSKIKVIRSISEIIDTDKSPGGKYVFQLNNFYFLIQVTGQYAYDYNIIDYNRENIWS